MFEYILALLIGYLAGSVPFGLVLGKLAGLGDIRKQGSGNIGATNVLRTGRKDIAAATLILDGAKGAVVTAIFLVFSDVETAAIAGFFAVLGHNFPVWLRFKGGKGVATSLGVIWVLAWPVGVACCLSWLVVAGLFRISSLAAIISLILAPIFALFFATPVVAWLAAALAVLGLWRHRANIKRLLAGQEPRIGRRA